MKKSLLTFITLVALCLISCEEKRTDAPTGFEAKQVNNSIELKWNAVYDAKEYHLENLSTGLSEFITSTSFVDKNPKEGQNNYELRACGSTYGWSESVYASCQFKRQDLPAPTGFTLTQTSEYVQLKWNKVSGAAGYYALWYNTEDSQWYILQETTSTSYKDYDVTAGTTYIYGVAAFDANDNYSEIVYDEITFNGNSGGGGGGTSKPNTPTGVTATAYSSYIKISWSSVSGATSYYVYRATSSSGTYSFIDATSSTSYYDYDVSSGTTYYYKVSAVNSAGESAKSSYDYASISGGGGGGGTSKPNTPTGVTATAYSSYIKVTWNSASGATSYYVYRSTSSSGTYRYIDESYSTSYSDYDVSSGTTYYYKVSAVNSAGESSKSSYDYASISGGGGGGGSTNYEPCPPSVTCSGTSSVSIRWTASTGYGCGTPTSYEVKRSNRITGQAETLKSGTSSTSYTDSQPFPGVNLYGVIASNSYGSSSAGTAISSEVGIDAPQFYDGISGDSHVLYIDIKGLNVPNDWKPYYKLELHWATSYSGYYTAQTSWNYNDYTLSLDNNNFCYTYDFGNVDFSGKTFYYKLRWVFDAPYSPSPVYGSFTSIKTVTHRR